MSKSLGNFYTLENVLEKGYSPMDFRTLLLGAHYRTQMNFTWEALEQAKKNKEALFFVVERLSDIPKEENDPEGFDGADSLGQIREAMRDDLNTPQALALTLSLAKEINTLLDKKERVNSTVLGLVFEKIFFFFGLHMEEKQVIPTEVTTLAEAREVARKGKDFEESDRLRQEILHLGYKVEDLPGGYKFRKI